MITFVKTSKYDELFRKILYIFYFSYQYFFLILVSDFVVKTPKAYKIVSLLVMGSFCMIVLVAFYNFLRGRFKTVEFAIYVIIGVIFLISLYNYREVMVMANLFFIAAFKEEDGKKALKYYLFATVLGYISNIIIGLITGYSGDIEQLRNGAKIIRHAIGFSHYILCAHYFLCMLLVYILLRNKLKMYEYIIIIALELVIFKLTDTKAALILVFFTLILYVVLVNCNLVLIRKIFGIITILSFPVFSTAILVLSRFYDGNVKWMSFINHFITGRLVVTQNAMNMQSITLFGSTLNSNSLDALYDSVYINMFMQNGIIVFIICILFMTFFAYLAYKDNNTVLLIVLFILALRSMFDLGIMAMQLAPQILLFMPLCKKYVFK